MDGGGLWGSCAAIKLKGKLSRLISFDSFHLIVIACSTHSRSIRIKLDRGIDCTVTGLMSCDMDDIHRFAAMLVGF